MVPDRFGGFRLLRLLSIKRLKGEGDMRPESEQITTNDIDLAAAVMTLTEHQPTLEPGRVPGRDLVEIIFPATDEIRLIAQRYATGELLAPVKRLARMRTTLYRYIKEVERQGRGVAL
jgi:hypothetical protein